jgi:hypothetical protein
LLHYRAEREVSIFSPLIFQIPVTHWFLYREFDREKWGEIGGRSGRLAGAFLLQLTAKLDFFAGVTLQSGFSTSKQPQQTKRPPGQ